MFERVVGKNHFGLKLWNFRAVAAGSGLEPAEMTTPDICSAMSLPVLLAMTAVPQGSGNELSVGLLSP